ncbi:hypothetical protein V8C86DRAFT_3151888 [Haematococcus lacustris]
MCGRVKHRRRMELLLEEPMNSCTLKRIRLMANSRDQRPCRVPQDARSDESHCSRSVVEDGNCSEQGQLPTSVVIQSILWPVPSCPETAELMATHPCPPAQRYYVNSHGGLVTAYAGSTRHPLNQALLQLTHLHQLPAAQQPIISLAPQSTLSFSGTCTPCSSASLSTTSTTSATSSQAQTFYRSSTTGSSCEHGDILLQPEDMQHCTHAVATASQMMAAVTRLSAEAAARAAHVGALALDCELFGTELVAEHAAAVVTAAAAVRVCGLASAAAGAAPLGEGELQRLLSQVAALSGQGQGSQGGARERLLALFRQLGSKMAEALT